MNYKYLYNFYKIRYSFLDALTFVKLIMIFPILYQDYSWKNVFEFY